MNILRTMVSVFFLLRFCAAAQATIQTDQPVITATAAKGGARVVTLSAARGAKIYYTLNGAQPGPASLPYLAPILVSTPLTVKAVALRSGATLSKVATYTFATKIPSGTLVWSEEFANPTEGNIAPNSATWTYDTGSGGWGNQELETYCAAGSNAAPCTTARPNAYIDPGGLLHIVARQASAGVYTSARMKSQNHISFQYGRFEARIRLPESQGMWPAFWLLGNNIETVNWPGCGELDVMEHIDGAKPGGEGHDWVAGSVHGPKLDGSRQYTAAGFSAAQWHVYGMIWTRGEVRYYVDSPAKVYATYTRSSVSGAWPFDDGPEFLILNLAVGGDWPGNPDSTTVFPGEMQVDYVRVYSN
jgi:beta-glucanase (GH16 family)